MQCPNKFLLIATLIGLPVIGHAADVAPLTRAEVKAQLVDAELSGQLPISNTRYPERRGDPALIYEARKATRSAADGPSASTESSK